MLSDIYLAHILTFYPACLDNLSDIPSGILSGNVFRPGSPESWRARRLANKFATWWGEDCWCTWLGECVCGHVCGRVPPGCLVNLKNLTGGEWSYPTSGSWETSVPNPSIGWSSFLRMAMPFFGGTPHWQTNPAGPEFAHIYAKTNLREMNGEMDLTGLAMTTRDSRDINHQRNGMW